MTLRTSLCILGCTLGLTLFAPFNLFARDASSPAATATDLLTSEAKLATATGTLSGTLRLAAATPSATPATPATPAPISAPKPIVIIHPGSGPTDRDGNSAGFPGKNNSLRMLAEGLAEAGMATLAIDKRGIGASAAAGPREQNMRFDMYVDDLIAWANWAKQDRRFSRVILLGHSEGALVAMLAAGRGNVDAYVSLAGIGDTFGDTLRRQLQRNLPEDSRADALRTIETLEAGKPVTSLPPSLAMLFRPSVQPYLISILAKRPRAEIAKLTLPILIIQGTTDIQVAVKDAEILRAGAPSATLAVIEGMNHVLKKVDLDQSRQLASYSDPAQPLHPALIPALTAWLQKISAANAVAEPPGRTDLK